MPTQGDSSAMNGLSHKKIIRKIFKLANTFLKDRNSGSQDELIVHLEDLYYRLFREVMPTSSIPVRKWDRIGVELMHNHGHYKMFMPKQPIPVLWGLIEYYGKTGLYRKSNAGSTQWRDAKAMYERMGLPVPQEVIDKAAEEEQQADDYYDLYAEWRENNAD